jgi:DNA adenine methylase
MQYFGGKSAIAKEITSILKEYRGGGQLFVEPFCGGLNITALMGGRIIANDKNYELIEMYKAIQNGWSPPEYVSEQEYNDAKTTSDAKLKAFIGIGCSFGAKWFGGYARSGDVNFALRAKHSLEKKFKTIKDVTFLNVDYKELNYNNALIYCDPPYSNVTQYKFGKFDTDEFWQWCRNMSKNGNTVIISEYNAPDDFKCIWQKKKKLNMQSENNRDSVEKLFIAP